MNLEPLRSLHSKLSIAFVAAVALVLSSCGGGGATSSPNNVGSLQLLPSTGSLYAGVPYTFNIVGGRKPYLITSTEQTLLPLNLNLDGNQFTVVARNPGVVDVGLDPNEVPRRTVTIEIRDSVGAAISSEFSVLQNFFTGYSQFFTSTCLGTEPPQACSGSESIVTLFPISNGALYGNREFQLDRVRGDYSFVVEDPTVTPQLVNQLRVRSDHNGKVIVRLRVAVNAVTQIASFKVTDIATQATTDVVFFIVQQAPVDFITALPNEIQYTGALSTQCGSGSTDVFLFGGVPPYTIVASTGVGFSPSVVTTAGGRLTISVSQSAPPCQTGLVVTIRDSRGAVSAIPITLNVGSGTLPPVTVSPTSISGLGCGESRSVTMIGGAASLSIASLHSQVTATQSGSTLTMTRRATDSAPGPHPTDGAVTITDGATITTVAISGIAPTCPVPPAPPAP